MTLDESTYILGRFDKMCGLLVNPPTGYAKMSARLWAYLRNDLVGSMTACVLDEELADWQDSRQRKEVAAETAKRAEQREREREREKAESESVSAVDVAVVPPGWSARPEDQEVCLETGLWIDKDGRVRTKDGKFL